MLPYSEWLEEAEKLSEGVSNRVQHLCGDGDVLIVEHTREGYRAWCHRCHEGGWKPHGRQSLEQQLKNWENADAELINSTTIKLPSDVSTDIPGAGLLWLSRGGITTRLCRKYNICYSEYYSRVFLPIYMDDALVYYQARAVHKGQTPKYINPKVNRNRLRFVSYKATQTETEHTETIVVTEDILSAIRVGEVKGCRGCSILGTTASASDLNFIAGFKRIILWFDPDEAGRKCSIQIERQLGLLGRNVSVMRSDYDPKIYTHLELEEMLSEQLRCNDPSDTEGA